MNLEEYRRWLSQNGNKEEAQADRVAEVVLNFHSPEHNDYNYSLHPRKVVHFDGGKLEFDLLVHLSWTGDNGHIYDRLIGVEFKETDMCKVVKQAVARRDLVDYMYIATRNVWLSERELMQLFFYNIGWIVWFDDGFAKLVLPSLSGDARYKWILMNIVEREVKKVIDKLCRGEIASLKNWMEV